VKSKLVALIEIRKIIAILVTVLFIYLAVTDRLDHQFIMNVIIMIVSFYFAKSTALDTPRNSEIPDKQNVN
jgi:hypothetical protein